MSTSYHKVKSVSKQMMSRGPELQKLIMDTLGMCSSIVGSTLGPGGMSVVIERQETGLPPIVTKDGVTVFRSLGFENSTQHVLMETAREASIRTASEAGDGTTTATILSEALVRYSQQLNNKMPTMSPQRISRYLEKGYDEFVEPFLKKGSKKASLGTKKGKKLLWNVARVSANGDEQLADAVMECFDIVGDQGNVTIVESSGPSRYEVEKIEGYPVATGYEESCGPFYQEFINDRAVQKTVMEKPTFLLYFGRITDFNQLFPILGLIAQEASSGKCSPNVVIVATGFSEKVLANMAASFNQEGTIRPYPLVAPRTSVKNSEYEFMLDVAALTGTRIYSPLDNPLENITSIDDLGSGPSVFEATRFRSNIVGHKDELLVLERVDQLYQQVELVASKYEKTILEERLAKMTSGIARLVVYGSSNGEVKEKRDRAEDAVCAVRGAIVHGALPGGGATLMALSAHLAATSGDGSEYATVLREVFSPALQEPVFKLFENVGYTREDSWSFMNNLSMEQTFDIAEHKYITTKSMTLVDSTPAVTEAIRNAISVAGLLGTCGGTVVFHRDSDLERSEARDSAEFVRNLGTNEANERG